MPSARGLPTGVGLYDLRNSGSSPVTASTGQALGGGIRCDVCGQLYRVAPGQRISEADRKRQPDARGARTR